MNTWKFIKNGDDSFCGKQQWEKYSIRIVKMNGEKKRSHWFMAIISTVVWMRWVDCFSLAHNKYEHFSFINSKIGKIFVVFYLSAGVGAVSVDKYVLLGIIVWQYQCSLVIIYVCLICESNKRDKKQEQTKFLKMLQCLFLLSVTCVWNGNQKKFASRKINDHEIGRAIYCTTKYIFKKNGSVAKSSHWPSLWRYPNPRPSPEFIYASRRSNGSKIILKDSFEMKIVIFKTDFLNCRMKLIRINTSSMF